MLNLWLCSYEVSKIEEIEKRLADLKKKRALEMGKQ
jgi:hypothetical protein